MRSLIPFLFLLSLFSSKAWSYVEFSADFSYDKQVYGPDRNSSLVQRVYSGSIASYIFAYTALELNFSVTEEITTDNNRVLVDGTNTSLSGYQSNVENTVYGIGIRQALAGRGAFIRPMISLGYAKQFVRSYTDYRFTDNSTGQTVTVTDDIEKSRVDSVFATFVLQFRLSKHLAVRGSVNSVFPAFDYDLAKDDLKYMLGLTWVF